MKTFKYFFLNLYYILTKVATKIVLQEDITWGNKASDYGNDSSFTNYHKKRVEKKYFFMVHSLKAMPEIYDSCFY